MNYFNTGENPRFQPLDIGHRDYCVLIEPETAFWTLIPKKELWKTLSSKKFQKRISAKIADYRNEIDDLRFNLKPSAVYFNPTDKCNLNCKYCYIPENIRKNGSNMSFKQICEALKLIKDFFVTTLPKKRKAQIVFHGAEPMANKDVVFKAIDTFRNDFVFGIQSNGTLIDDSDADFIKKNKIMIGLSIDSSKSQTANKTRQKWNGEGTFNEIEQTLTRFSGYDAISLICTITTANLKNLPDTIEYFHNHGITNCLVNALRCTQKKARELKPTDNIMAKYFIRALNKTHKLYSETGRKIIVANFANILFAILAPKGRKLMCDISPCGAGRCFFAVNAAGDVFPCSEFIGLKKFKGGNIFSDRIQKILSSKPFREVTGRKTENILYCSDCAIKHFCGAPCPAEAYTMNGKLNQRGAFCRFYEEQVRFAFRLIADGIHEDFLPFAWSKDMLNNEI